MKTINNWVYKSDIYGCMCFSFKACSFIYRQNILVLRHTSTIASSIRHRDGLISIIPLNILYA